MSGSEVYSKVLKVLQSSSKRPITVYPNPVTGGIINLQMPNHPGGMYTVQLINKAGQIVHTVQIVHTPGSMKETIQLENIPACGAYQLEVLKPGGDKENINISIMK